MVRTFAGLIVLGIVVSVTAVLGARVLERRWDPKGFYE